MNRLRLGMLSLAGFVWLGCSAAGTNPIGGSGGTTGAGGSVGTGNATGAGGTVVGAGGAVVGAGGTVVGAGGTVVGAGGTVVGAGGTVVGAGGSSGTACTGEASTTSYLDNGTLCGFTWTAMNKDSMDMEIPGQSIDPPCTMSDGSDCFTGGTICATAEVPANATGAYSGVMIGWNVSQSSSGGAVGNWLSTGTGITVNYTATGGTGEIRIILQSGSTDYCAIVTASGQSVPLTSFVKECWDGGAGTPAFTVGSPVKALLLQLNGTDAAQTVTNFCLNSVTMN